MPSILQSIILSTALVAFAVEGSPGLPSWRRNAPKAIYFQSNNDNDNTIVALSIKRDGTVAPGSITKTGGKGLCAIDSSTGGPSAPDSLNSQSPVVVIGNYLFTVNSGSNTVSMFSISPLNPTILTAVGRPASIPGDFPNTVAVSAKNNLVCVGLTGVRSGVSCAPFTSRGIGQMDALRPFGLGQTTPPVGFDNTVSQVFFSLDEKKLITMVKGTPPHTTGFVSVFPVNTNTKRLTRSETRSSPKGTGTLFGTTPIPGTTNLFTTDITFGGAILAVGTNNKVTMVHKVAIPDQLYICWTTISAVTNSAWTTDGGLNRLVEMSLTDASILSVVDLSNGDPSMTDLEAAGDFLYALSPGNGTTPAAITVVDVKGANARQIQHYNMATSVADKFAAGMAFRM